MQYMYIGRSVKKLNLKQNRVYRAKPESMIKALQGEYPLIEQLFVPVEEVSRAIEEVKTAGSARQVANQKMWGVK